MYEYKMTPASGGTLTEAAETEQTGKSYPVNYVITTPGEKQEIFDMLPVGERNAISTPALLAATGCGSVRELQSRISEERARGNLILSRGAGGYFRPSPGLEGKQEINRYMATLHARAVSTLRTLQTAKAALAVLDGQIDIDGGGGE